MKNIFSKLVLVAFLVSIGTGGAYARECTTCKKSTAKRAVAQAKAAACKRAQSTAELNVNNVRAMINGYGNMWYDGSVAQYHLPKNSNTCPMFCAALWIGGTDVNEQLRIAALRFGSEGDDYWPGPLTIDGAASTDLSVCNKFDKHFIITKAEVQALMAMFDYTTNPPTRKDTYDEQNISQVIKEWPAHGGVNQTTYLAPFYDADGDGFYNYQAGDYPYYDFDNALCPSTLKANLAEGENYTPLRTMEDSVGIVHGGLLSDQVLKGDQTIWWVFNDMGNTHTETQGQPIGLEIRAQAFAFSTNDEINNMTFYSYEIINRSTYTLKDTYFSQWVDPDLGYSFDDYVGCDVKRGLGYCYNGDESDGPGSGSYSGIPPAVGIDFFQGPYMDKDGKDNPKIDIDKMRLYFPSALERYRIGDKYDTIRLTDDADLYYPLAWYFKKGDAIGNCAINGVNFGNNIIDDERFGMRRFVYYNNSSTGYNSEPSKATDYYNYLRGYWKNGQRMRFGGDGLSQNTTEYDCDFMFPGDSDPMLWGTDGEDPGFEWTEEQAGNAPDDRRFMQSAGPFTLEPGALNYITVGIPFAQATSGNAMQSVEMLRQIDDICQALFENCFKVLDGPDAPTLVVQELKNEVILYITYDNVESNNYGESYAETDPAIARYYTDGSGNRQEYTADQRKYKFEGYQIYQLKDANTSIADINDITKARLVAQCDLRNFYDSLTIDGTDTTVNSSPTIPIGTLVNYTSNSTTGLLTGNIMVTGANAGIQHVFRLTTDAFAAGRDPALVNNKEYYYLCIAYAHNRYKEYSQTEADLLDGQKEPYLAGRKNEWGGTIEPVVAIPHDPIAENGGTIVQAEFGMCPNITRIEGYGNGGSILKLTQKSLEELMGKPGEPAKAPGTSVLDATTGSLTLSNPCIIENPVYEENYGPVNVKVIDPLNIKPGKFVIKFNGINDQSKWVITNAEAGKPLWVENYVYDADNNIIDSVCVYSDTADFVIGRYNEQLFLDLGVSVAITNPKAVASDFVITTTPSGIAYGDGGYVNEGTLLSSSMVFADSEKQWLSGIPDDDSYPLYNWIRSGSQFAAGNLGAFRSSSDPVSTSEVYLDEDYYLTSIPANRMSMLNTEAFDKYQVFEKVVGGLWSPYRLTSTLDYHPGFCMKYYIAADTTLERWHSSPTVGQGYQSYNTTLRKLMSHSCNKSIMFNDMKSLPSVRIVLTSDTTKWTRCPVLEMCDDYTQAEGQARRFQMRRHASVDKNGDTATVSGASEDPSSPNYISDRGMGWFPGYAIDVTTGERLNIMFGEDSRYVQFNGRDMLWNPVSTVMDGTQNYVMGGRHFIYVMKATSQPFYKIFKTQNQVSKTAYKIPSYDAGRFAMNMLRIAEKVMTTKDPVNPYAPAYDHGILKDELAKPTVDEVRDAAALLFSTVAWVNMPLVNSRYAFDNPKDIPCDVTIEINVPTQYGMYWGANQSKPTSAQNGNNPMYMFELTPDIATITGTATAADATKDYRDSILALINVVPNPYYSYSTYETTSQLETKVRFINVPSRSTISIYTLDGTLVRRLGPTPDNVTTYDWDLHNHNGIPIAGGMYLVHVSVPDIGERVIKWFGTMRPVDLNSFQF